MEQFRPTSFKILPPVVKNILIINGLFYLGTLTFQSAFKIDLTDILGMHYFASENFKPFQIVTYMFMHGSFGHIFFNMFAVWMFGNVLESFWGPKKFLTYYMITGIGAILIQMLITYIQLHPIQQAISIFSNDQSQNNFNIAANQMNFFFTDQNFADFNSHRISAMEFLETGLRNRVNTTTIGASGAVFGVLLAFGMMFPNSLIYVYFAIPIKAKWFVIIYGAIELYTGILNNPSDNVAHFAHLGGMLFGLILIMYWNKRIKGKYF